MSTVAEHEAFAKGDAVALVPRDVVTVHGPDAASFLQGQLSQDVERLEPGGGAWSFVLEPTGKVVALVGVTRDRGDGFLLDADAGVGEAVLARLTRFKLRTKVELAAASGWIVGVRARGDAPRQAIVDVGGGAFFAWGAGPVQRYLTDGPHLRVGDLPVIGADVYELWRIEHGVPVVGAELVPGETIPAEAGAWLIDAAVSFTKGCYTGQELVARIDSRGGNVPRHLRGVRIHAPLDGVPPVGAEVVAFGKVVGALTSVAWSPLAEQPVALASIARAVEPPADAEVRWDHHAAPARVQALPLREPTGA